MCVSNEELVLQKLTSIEAKIDGLTTDVAEIKVTLDEHMATLDEHTATLDEHTDVLNTLMACNS